MFSGSQILNLQTRVRFPVALPILFQLLTPLLTQFVDVTVASFVATYCTVCTVADNC